MQKKTYITLIVLILGLSTCGGCSSPAISGTVRPTAALATAHHISELAFHGDFIYFGAGYCLYRLNVRDQVLDEIVCTEDWMFQRPAVDGEQAYASVMTEPSVGQFFVAIDISTGTVSWRVDESDIGPYRRNMKQSTFIVRDLVIAVQESRSDIRQRIYAFDKHSGKQIWRTKHESLDTVRPYLIYDDSVWYPTGGKLVAVDVDTGETREASDLLPDVEFDKVIYVNDTWMFGVDRTGMSEYSLFAVERSNPGQASWRAEIVPPGSAIPIDLYDDLLIIRNGEHVYALNVHTGQKEWTFNPGHGYTSTPAPEQIAVFTLKEMLYALDAETGAAIWEYPLQSYTGKPTPCIEQDRVYIGNQDRIDVLDRSTGELLWSVDVDSWYKFYVDYL